MTNIWISHNNQAYTGLTVHYVDDCYQPQSHLLENAEFLESHTGSDILEELEAICRNGIHHRITCLL